MRLFVLTLAVAGLFWFGCSSDPEEETADTEIAHEGFDTPPNPISSFSPAYPVDARNDQVSGTAHVEVLVDTAGTVQETRIIQSAGDPRLDEAARHGALQWKFQPATLEGRPVSAKIVIPIKFEL